MVVTGRPPLLEAESLQRRYRGRTVLDIDRLRLEAGEVLAILGPNGSGKSTLFRLLLLLERADAGTIRLDGRVVQPGDRTARARMAAVFQRPFLFAGTVASNVAYGLAARRVSGTEREKAVVDALREVSLSERARTDVSELSGGEAQRVALARALVLRPDLLLLDEPTSNLDLPLRRRFRSDLERLSRSHAGAVVLITHDPADALTLADRVAVLEAGRVVQVATPESLVLSPATPFVAAMTGAELLLDGIVAEVVDGLVEVRLASGASLLTAPSENPSRLAPGTPAHVAYRPEDVVLAHADSAGPTSARNRFDLRVTALSPVGGLVRVHLEGELDLIALVTRGSVEALGIAPDAIVQAQIKAAALRPFPAAPPRGESPGVLSS